MAERYIVTGKACPERADINFTQVVWNIPGEGKVTASCEASQITVIVELDYVDGWISALIAAEHFTYIIISALGFSLGSGYSVEIVQIIEEDGASHTLGVRPTGDSPDITLGFTPYDLVFRDAFELANRNIFFRLALRDYCRAINDAIDCPVICYRVIESIKSSFDFRVGKKDWENMHTAIGTDQPTIEDTVKKFADPIRHGNWIEAPTTNKKERWKMLLFTRDILIKFMKYELSNK